jgi:uncharacterized protein YjbJ (UPF0337 family)
MDWNQISGKWQELKGRVRTQWNKLTDDDVGQIAGKKDELVGALQRRYGYEKEEAMKRIDAWADSLKDKIDERPKHASR